MPRARLITGFILEVRPTSKTYALRYIDASGVQRQHRIGPYDSITFDQARKAAKRLRSEVVLGGNPAAEKQEKKAVPTYATLAEQHIAHAKTYQRSWWSTEGLIRKHLLPRWGRSRLTAITSREISSWLAEKAAAGLSPASCEKLRILLGRGFQLAIEWELPGVVRNPVRSVPRRKFDNRRERFLSAEEANRLLEAAGQSSNTQLRSITHLLLLSGCRVSELLTAKWRHVDLEKKTWLIPTSKNGKARYVPLSKAAIAVIETLPRFEGCPYLIPNPETKKPYVSIKRAWQTARARADLQGFRLHDCRHSAASFYIAGGADLYTVSKLLGHANYASSERYSHVADKTLLAAVEAGAMSLGGGVRAETPTTSD